MNGTTHESFCLIAQEVLYHSKTNLCRQFYYIEKILFLEIASTACLGLRCITIPSSFLRWCLFCSLFVSLFVYSSSLVLFKQQQITSHNSLKFDPMTDIKVRPLKCQNKWALEFCQNLTLHDFFLSTVFRIGNLDDNNFFTL